MKPAFKLWPVVNWNWKSADSCQKFSNLVSKKPRRAAPGKFIATDECSQFTMPLVYDAKVQADAVHIRDFNDLPNVCNGVVSSRTAFVVRVD